MRSSLVLLLLCGTPVWAQTWEIGGTGGFGFYHRATVTAPAGTAQAGPAAGFAAGLVIGDDLYKMVSGEFRYTYRDGDLELRSQGNKASMEGHAHAIHYDILLHATPRGSKIRPFVAVGGGIKVYEGTGKESAYQPLSNYAFLTRTDQVKPMISFGGGVKIVLAKHAQLRFDFRDYVTPTPEKLFAPAPGAKLQGWLNDFVPLIGIGFIF
jgi:hypothetical protein